MLNFWLERVNESKGCDVYIRVGQLGRVQRVDILQGSNFGKKVPILGKRFQFRKKQEERERERGIHFRGKYHKKHEKSFSA